MTEELKQLREALRRVKHEAASLADAQVIALEALTQRPAAQAGEREAFEAELAKMPDWAPECEKLRPWVEWILWVFWQARASLPTQPAAQATPDVPETDFGKMAKPEPLHLFEFWWESHMPQATQSQAWAAWTAAQNSKGATIDAAQATPEPVQPRTFDARNATFREQNWQIRFDAAVESRRLAQEQLYTERERHTAEVKRLQLEIGRLTATPESVGEPFGYFRSLRVGWEQCGEHDDGAVALYTRPAPGVPEGWTVSAYKAAGLTIQSVAQLKGPDRWKIADASGNVLNKQGEWEWEPSPSNRDDAFLARCRYATLAEASAALAAAQAKGGQA